MDSVHPEENSGGKGRNSRVLVKAPQIIVIVGAFREEEIKILEDTLKNHFPDWGTISWISYGENPLSTPDVFKNDPLLKSSKYLKQREECRKRMQEEDEVLFLKSAVASIFNSTASLICQEPGVRVSIIVKPEQPLSGLLTPMVHLLMRELKEQFSRVSTDAYLVMDQSAFRELRSEKEASIFLTLKETEELIRESGLNYAYVVSNMTNHENLLAGKDASEEQFTSIALAIAMKDLIPENTENKYLYSDRDFNQAMEDTRATAMDEPGVFSSLGALHLGKDEHLSKLVVYRTVWDALRSSDPNLDLEELQHQAGLFREGIKKYFGMSRHLKSLSRDDFDAIVWDHSKEEQSVFTMTCGEAVRQYFGRNLDLFMELNMYGSEGDRKMEDWMSSLKSNLQQISEKAGFYNLVLLLERGEKELDELIAEADQIIETQNIGLSQWEGQVFAQKYNGIPKGISPLYFLAQDYLKYRSSVYAGEQQKKISEELLSRVHELSDFYRNYKMLVQGTIESLDREIEGQKDSLGREKGIGLLRMANAEEYYSSITLDLIDRNRRRPFRGLINELGDLLSNGGFQKEEAFRLVEEYCNAFIFTDERFQDDFMHELQKRLIGYKDGVWDIRTETDVSNFLLAQVSEAQHYLFFDRVQQGFQAYEEMALFLQNDSVTGWQKDSNAIMTNRIKEQKMKLFCDSSCSSLDVLFLAGNLKPQSIYKWDIYESAYQELSESDQSD